jgi:hypothetical protein
MSSNGDSAPTVPPDQIHVYLGPYELWNFGPGRPYALLMFNEYWRYISALAELGGKMSSDQAIAALGRIGWIPTLWENGRGLTFIPFVLRNRSDEMPNVDELRALLGVLFENATDQRPGTPIAPAQVTGGADFVRVAHSRFRVAFPIPDGAMHAGATRNLSRPSWQPDKDLCGRVGDKKITVIAVIDDGLPFAHLNFRSADEAKTRVEFCWLQAAKIDEQQQSVLFGREYTRRQIEQYIEDYGHDEDTLYHEAGAASDTEGLGSPIDWHATHGAHVMDLATGYSRARREEPAEEIRIIAVQMPNTIAWDTSGFGKDMYMLSAFHYIFDRADMIAEGYGVKNLRLVINFSYGFSGGRHDGQTELEAAINELIEKRRTRDGNPCPTALVLPAGNTFLDRLHGVLWPSDFVSDEARFHWRIQPNDRTPCYLELWFWQGFDPNGYFVELWDPWDELQSSLEIQIDPASTQGGGDPIEPWPVLNQAKQTVGEITVDLHRPDRTNPPPDRVGRWRVLIVMAPTEPADPGLARAQCGKWTVVVRRGPDARPLEQPIHCWIQRSTDPQSLRSGSRQSYFDDWRNVRYTREGDLAETDTEGAFVRRFGSFNGLATGDDSLVVAGYRLVGGLGASIACARPALYSAAGARGPEDPDSPPEWPDKEVDCSSMSERSRVLAGTIAAGTRSGSLSLLDGTSGAAPFVARQLAETFTTASELDVQQAASDNYRSLLRDYREDEPENDPAIGIGDCEAQECEGLRTRLGAVRVRPNWQPGIEPPRRRKTVPARDGSG